MGKTIMVRRVPEDLHQAFRIWCFQNQVSMNQQLIKLMASTVGVAAPPAPQIGGYRPRNSSAKEAKLKGLALAEKYREEMETGKPEDLEEL